MAQTVTLTQSAYKELTNRVSRLEKMVTKLLEEFQKEPPYGSDLWWEWSDKKALAEIEKGHFKEFSSAKEMVKHLNSR